MDPITHWTARRSVCSYHFFERAVPYYLKQVTATMQIFVKTLTGK